MLTKVTSILALGLCAYQIYSFASLIYTLYSPPTCEFEQVSKCVTPSYSTEQTYEIELHLSSLESKIQKNSKALHSNSSARLSDAFDVDIPLSEPTMFIEPLKKGKTVFVHLRVKEKVDGVSKTIARIVRPLTAKRDGGDQTKRKLLGKMSQTDEDLSEGKTLAHFSPNMTINFVDDYTRYPTRDIPYDIYTSMKFTKLKYAPVLYFNALKNVSTSMVPVKEHADLSSLTLHFHYQPISLGQFRVWKTLEGSLQQTTSMMNMQEKDLDSVKEIFGTSTPLLLTTMSVAMLHMLFSFLAFQSDISFWRNKKGHGGLSMRYLLSQCAMSIIIFLFLVDSGQTNPILLVTTGISVFVELWKMTRIFEFSIGKTAAGFPKISIRSQNETALQTATNSYDQLCMRYLSYILYPLVIGYALYSLYYDEHKSWYSWVIKNLANGAYALGFVFMTPQLFINYKLKSTAHLPWKAMTYKALDTFIDDMFSFIITMPTAHRLAVLRDDLVFFVFLYQKWLYPTDMSRANEFGQTSADDSSESEMRAANGGTSSNKQKTS